MKFSMFQAVSRFIHVLSSVWVFVLALVILIDVVGRVVFSQPLPGTKEILQNSVIAVTFLQIPLAIYSGSMLRTTLVTDLLPPFVKRVLRSLTYILGFALFAAIGSASFPEAMDAMRIGEYEGEGAMRIYTWPIRFLIVGTAAFAAIAYLTMMIADWTGALDDTDALSTR